jgi:hypothetical protein
MDPSFILEAIIGLIAVGVAATLRVVLRTDKAIPVIQSRLNDHDRRIGKLEDLNH